MKAYFSLSLLEDHIDTYIPSCPVFSGAAQWTSHQASTHRELDMHQRCSRDTPPSPACIVGRTINVSIMLLQQGNSKQEGTFAKISFSTKKTFFLGTITKFSRVNRRVTSYFCWHSKIKANAYKIKICKKKLRFKVIWELGIFVTTFQQLKNQ